MTKAKCGAKAQREWRDLSCVLRSGHGGPHRHVFVDDGERLDGEIKEWLS